MKILYVSQYFPPEMGAPAARVSELSRHWVEMGHQVTVLTGFPNHPTGIVPVEYRPRLWRLTVREQYSGVDVVRTWLWPLPNRRGHERIRNYASFCFSAGMRGLLLERPDVVIATSPQLLVPLAGWWLSRAMRVPFVFEVRDLWPESLEAVGVSGRTSTMYRSLRRLAGFLYRNCERIVVVTPAFKQQLVTNLGVLADKIEIVENGVETDLFTPEGDSNDLRRQLGLEGKLVIAYIGTFGNAHGLEIVLEAAQRLSSRMPQAHFLLVGEGAEKDRIAAQAGERRLSNVSLLDQQPRERIPALIRAADICLVMLKKSQVFETVIPTKMLEFMACGRPVILTARGQAAAVLEGAGGGIAVPPEDSAELAKAIDLLAGNASWRDRLGASGREYIARNLSRKKTASNYVTVLAQVRDEWHLDAVPEQKKHLFREDSV
jgi:glycosyltransferase involved in cell wall biosynthesis